MPSLLPSTQLIAARCVSVSQLKARTHIIQIREPKPGALGNINRSQIGGYLRLSRRWGIGWRWGDWAWPGLFMNSGLEWGSAGLEAGAEEAELVAFRVS